MIVPSPAGPIAAPSAASTRGQSGRLERHAGLVELGQLPRRLVEDGEAGPGLAVDRDLVEPDRALGERVPEPPAGMPAEDGDELAVEAEPPRRADDVGGLAARHDRPDDRAVDRPRHEAVHGRHLVDGGVERDADQAPDRDGARAGRRPRSRRAGRPHRRLDLLARRLARGGADLARRERAAGRGEGEGIARGLPSSHAARNPASNASPAPVVSTARTGMDAARATAPPAAGGNGPVGAALDDHDARPSAVRRQGAGRGLGLGDPGQVPGLGGD